MKNTIKSVVMVMGIVCLLCAVCTCKTVAQANPNPGGDQANPDPESDFEVEILDSGKRVMITQYLGNKMEVVIPSKIRGKPVDAIQGSRSRIAGDLIFKGAFQEKSLIKVTIPDSVTTIGEWAFGDNELTSVTIPNSVTFIGKDAFSHNELTSVTIPNSVEMILQGAFSHNQLTSVTIPDSVTWIDRDAFIYNQLTSITIGANIKLEFNSFDFEFLVAYANAGGAAGTYTRPNGSSTTWTKQ